MFHSFPDGSVRPTCVNIGCNKPVTLSKGKLTDLPSKRILRTVCIDCHHASYGKKTLKSNVTSHKKSYCENIDGRLGVNCTATNLDSAQLELDHIDGNHLNNDPSNVQTLCKNCHSKKSISAGDYRKACRSHSSPGIQIQSNFSSIFSHLFDFEQLTKTDPNLQIPIPCTEEIG